MLPGVLCSQAQNSALFLADFFCLKILAFHGSQNAFCLHSCSMLRGKHISQTWTCKQVGLPTPVKSKNLIRKFNWQQFISNTCLLNILCDFSFQCFKKGKNTKEQKITKKSYNPTKNLTQPTNQNQRCKWDTTDKWVRGNVHHKIRVHRLIF